MQYIICIVLNEPMRVKLNICFITFVFNVQLVNCAIVPHSYTSMIQRL